MSDAPGGPGWERGNDGKWYMPGVLSGAGWIRGAGDIWYPPPPPKGAPPRYTPRQPGAGAKNLEDFIRRHWVLLLAGGAALALIIIVAAAVGAIVGDDEGQQAATERPASTQPEPTTTPEEPTTTTEEEPAPEIDTETTVEVIDEDTVDLTGSTTPGATVTADWSGGPAEATAGPQGNFTITITSLEEGSTRVTLVAEGNGGESDEVGVTVTKTISEGLFKFLTRQIPYDELIRDPDSLAGQTVNFRGQVFQYDANTGTSSMLVSVTPLDFDFWTDNIIVTLDPAISEGIDQDDIILLWGTVVGAQTYDTAIGGQNTLPLIDARYMQLESKG